MSAVLITDQSEVNRIDSRSDRTMAEQSAKYQYLAAFVVNLLTIGYGVACGWASPSTALLLSEESPLASGVITLDQASWVASFLCVGGLIGNILFGYVTNRFGRKNSLMFIAIPAIVGWLFILFAQNVYHLYIARTLNGLVGGGIIVIIPIFLSEIANDRVRGVLGSTFVFSANTGMLIAFIMGNYCSFHTMPKFVIVLMILFIGSFITFPESPSFLIKMNQLSLAENSIRFYQNMPENNGDYEQLRQEMSKLQSTISGQKMTPSNDNSLAWSDFVSLPSRKAFTISLVLVALNQFCGCLAMLNYSSFIFKESGSSMSLNESTIIVGLIQLLGSFVATNLVDRAGRKILFSVSTIGTALGQITFGVYMLLKSWQYNVEDFNWIPVLSLSFVIFVASLAILPLPFLVISEVLPESVKNFGMSFCMNILWIFAFIMIKYLPIVTEALELHTCLFIFAGVCLSSAVFIISFVPETKGRSYEQIMASLR